MLTFIYICIQNFECDQIPNNFEIYKNDLQNLNTEIKPYDNAPYIYFRTCGSNRDLVLVVIKEINDLIFVPPIKHSKNMDPEVSEN